MILIYVNSPTHAIPLCRDVTGKEMKMACIYNIGPCGAMIYVEGTPLRYRLPQGECRHCVVTEGGELVAMHLALYAWEDGIQMLDLDGSNPKNVIYNGEFQLTRDGFVNLSEYRIKYSNHGNPFVYARDDVAVDAQGYLWARGYLEDNFYRPWTEEDQVPRDPRFIFAMRGGELGLTQDRRVWYKGRFVSGIADPVVDIGQNFFGVFCLTCSGDVYFVKTNDKSLQAALLARGATAIANSYQSHYFVFGDEQAKLHVYEDLRDVNPETKPCRIISTHARRISELALYQDELVCRYVTGGYDRFWASSGERVSRW